MSKDVYNTCVELVLKYTNSSKIYKKNPLQKEINIF